MFLLWTASSLFPLLAPAPALAADTQFLHGHIPAVVAKLNLQPVAPMPGTNPFESGDAAAYSVIVTSVVGSLSSPIAPLTVIDPAMTTSPQSQTVPAGSNASLSVVAEGSSISPTSLARGRIGSIAASWRRERPLLCPAGACRGSETDSTAIKYD
jgi:hypothetical protein